MIFILKNWDNFCKRLSEAQKKSITLSTLREQDSINDFVSLKHDVETNISAAFQIATIESKYGHCGSYYVQAYLLKNEENVSLLKKMKDMGHEITYHHDVMDSNKGDIGKAIEEFSENLSLFEKNGFSVTTVCQHGNPVVERVGYNSNRDFFRNEKVRNIYPDISDIMVDFPDRVSGEYDYYSDAGRQFKLIYDPINNDVINSDNKNIPFKNLDVLLDNIKNTPSGAIISIHPHRWMSSATKYIIKNVTFKLVKSIAKTLMKVPFFKKIMSRYYYLAKKI